MPQLDREDPVLGWRPASSQISRATATINGKLVYDVNYSTDEAGRRIAPPDRGDDVEGCVWFFADSFVFGEGVSDHETFPYLLGIKTDGRFRIINFAFSGYGAEHMLAILERGELATSVPCEPTNVFYAALPHHVVRAAGKTEFSIRGPRYRVGSTGVPEYLGTQPGVRASRPLKRLLDQLSKSRVYRAVAHRPVKTTTVDIDLYFAIVKQAFRWITHRWPRAQLELIVWDVHSFYAHTQSSFHGRLKALGARMHFIEHILHGYGREPEKYSLHAFELHPNPLAHQLVASYLAQHLSRPQRQSGP
jgi:hypothetical protein